MDSRFKKILLITKEFGKIQVPDGKWSNIILSEITLHSVNEPAVQEYKEKSVRCLWYYNGVHHSWTTPAIYTVHGEYDFLENHQFDIYSNYAYCPFFTTVYYMIHGKSVTYEEWLRRRISEWRKEKIESFIYEDN